MISTNCTAWIPIFFLKTGHGFGGWQRCGVNLRGVGEGCRWAYSKYFVWNSQRIGKNIVWLKTETLAFIIQPYHSLRREEWGARRQNILVILQLPFKHLPHLSCSSFCNRCPFQDGCWLSKHESVSVAALAIHWRQCYRCVRPRSIGFTELHFRTLTAGY